MKSNIDHKTFLMKIEMKRKVGVEMKDFATSSLSRGP